MYASWRDLSLRSGHLRLRLPPADVHTGVRFRELQLIFNSSPMSLWTLGALDLEEYAGSGRLRVRVMLVNMTNKRRALLFDGHGKACVHMRGLGRLTCAVSSHVLSTSTPVALLRSRRPG